MAEEIRIPKNGAAARAFLTLLLLGGSAFFVAMGVFATQASRLSCAEGPSTCVRRTEYPFGIGFEDPVAPIERAGIRVKSGRRGASLNLTLYHPDGSATEYPGVGTNGDRAAETVENLRRYLARPEGSRSFPLRSGSRPVGWAMIIVGLAALVLVPGIFNAVIFHRSGEELHVRVQRRPLKPRDERMAAADVEGLWVLPRQSAGRPVWVLALALRDREPVELGMAFSHEEAARARVQVLDERLAPVLRP